MGVIFQSKMLLAGAEDGGSGPWSAKVPILETEPPAMDSDYEEATTCELEEKLPASETVHQNVAELREDSDARRDVDDSTSDHATPVATSTTKPKPM